MHKNILLYKAMLQHFAGDPRRCQHLIKVASLAKEIAILEGADQAFVDTVAKIFRTANGRKLAQSMFGL